MAQQWGGGQKVWSGGQKHAARTTRCHQHAARLLIRFGPSGLHKFYAELVFSGKVTASLELLKYTWGMQRICSRGV